MSSSKGPRTKLGYDNPEGALSGVQPQSILPKSFEQLPQVDKVFLLDFRLGDHVIYIDFDFSVHHVVEQSHHSLLIGYPGVLEPKGHHLIAKRPPHGDEGGLFHILWRHLYLIGRIIHEDIDVRQREIVLGTGSI